MGELADEERDRWLPLQRLFWVGVDALEVLVEPAEALVAVVDPRQRPGVLGIVVRPRADQHALRATEPGEDTQEIVGVPIAPAPDQERGRLHLLLMSAEQPGLPERTVEQVFQVGEAPRLRSFKALVPGLRPLRAHQLRVGRGEVVGGHQWGIVLVSEGPRAAPRTGHAVVPVGGHLA